MTGFGFIQLALGAVLAALLTGCSLVVEFDRSLLLDSGVDGSTDEAEDRAVDASVDPGQDAALGVGGEAAEDAR